MSGKSNNGRIRESMACNFGYADGGGREEVGESR